jgi:hypothetical protein
MNRCTGKSVQKGLWIPDLYSQSGSKRNCMFNCWMFWWRLVLEPRRTSRRSPNKYRYRYKAFLNKHFCSSQHSAQTVSGSATTSVLDTDLDPAPHWVWQYGPGSDSRTHKVGQKKALFNLRCSWYLTFKHVFDLLVTLTCFRTYYLPVFKVN